jgi:Fe(3+) dicitrate transport protein
LFNSYHEIGGSLKKFSYSSFLNYRTLQGWRDNSNQQQFTGFGTMKYKFSEKLQAGLEYSLLRNKIKMPGGLTDEQFEANSQLSVRSRNWLESPWNLVSANLAFKPNEKTSLHLTTTYLAGERSLVWFNALPDVPDEIDPLTGAYADREIDREIMKSTATELRCCISIASVILTTHWSPVQGSAMRNLPGWRSARFQRNGFRFDANR